MAINPAYVVGLLDGAWNTNSVEGALAAFSDDATVRLMPPPPPPLPGVYTGRDEIRRFIEAFIPGFHVDSNSFQGSGDTVTWRWTATGDGFRQMGADPAAGAGEAVLDGYKVREFVVTFSQETLAKMQAAGAVIPVGPVS